VKTLRSQRVASPLVHRHLFGNQTQPTIDSKSPRHHEGFFWVHRHLPERYYSEPNGAAILLGRVDLPRAGSNFIAPNIDQCLPRESTMKLFLSVS
jgi:hypothetical protein